MNTSYDPKLTSWALNELSPDERAAFEEELKRNPALLSEAETTLNFCRFVQNHLRDEGAALTESQRARLKSAAAGNTRRAREEQENKVNVRPAMKPWWSRPAFVLPLSAAAAVVLGFIAFPGRELPMSGATGMAEPVLSATVSPQPQPRRSVLAPGAVSTEGHLPILATQPVKLVADVQLKLMSARRDPLEIDVEELQRDASPAARIVKTAAGALEAGERSAATLARLVTSGQPAPVLRLTGEIYGTGDVTVVKMGAATVTFAGTNTYTGGTVIRAGTLHSAGRGASISDDASVTVRGTARQGAAGHKLNELNYLGDKTQPVEITVGKEIARKDVDVTKSPAMAPAPVTLGRAVTSIARPAPAPAPAVNRKSLFGMVTSEGRPAMQAAVRDETKGDGLRRIEAEVGKLKDNVAELSESGGFKREGGEACTPIVENQMTEVAAQPLSTFSIDVDTAAYALVRRFLNSGRRPAADAVRIEEMINYFPYDYEFPRRGEAPFTVGAAVAEAPWNPTHRLARVAIKASEAGMERRQSNFVFLVDVSGSMDEPDKLTLVKQSLDLLTDQLTADDRVAVVTYAGGSGLALASTPGNKKEEIRGTVREMKAGGSTHGSAGIRLAYEEAQKNFIKDGVNRVILCTDGDFNVGISDPRELERFIKEKAGSGVFLSVLGYGTGNTKDATMETLADKGNGNYAYIDSLSEARKVLVDQMRGTLVTVAKDVKIQVEFNPAVVRSYRLIGYENRMLAREDFNNDRKDAGEIGAGHTVTALYEIVPVGAAQPDGRPVVDALKYQSVPAAVASEAAKSGEMMTVKLRYKKPDGDRSELIDFPVKDEGRMLKDSEREFKFAAAVAGFGLLLRNSSYKGEMTWENVRQLAISAKGEDANGYRGEFIQLIDKARGIIGDGRP